MSLNYEELRATIIGRMLAFTGIEQSRIDYQSPLVRFEPPADGLWCRVSIQTVRPITQGLCAPKARIRATSSSNALTRPSARRRRWSW